MNSFARRKKDIAKKSVSEQVSLMHAGQAYESKDEKWKS